MPVRCLIALLCASSMLACERRPPAREYGLHGQVLAIRPAEQEIVIRHGDIKGFMPGMTMPFRVKDRRLLDAAAPGDIVDATLVVDAGDAWLSRLTATGRREPLPDDATLPRRMEPPLQPGQNVPDTSFVDQDGRTLTIGSLRGAPWAATFVYTRCPLPTYCPALDRRFQEAQRAIAADDRLQNVRLISISIDPAFDTPAVLARHAARLEADGRIWRFATGDVATVDRFGGRFGLSVSRGGGRPEEFVHSLKTVVVGADGRVRRIYSGTEWTAVDLVRDLREASR
jgi:protein SCO1/2